MVCLVRGGGSLEDLWAFNNKQLARAIYDSQIPIMTGVGHEIDFTIADFVADLRAPTPSAAAELVSPEQSALLEALQQSTRRLALALQHQIRQKPKNLTGWVSGCAILDKTYI